MLAFSRKSFSLLIFEATRFLRQPKGGQKLVGFSPKAVDFLKKQEEFGEKAGDFFPTKAHQRRREDKKRLEIKGVKKVGSLFSYRGRERADKSGACGKRFCAANRRKRKG